MSRIFSRSKSVKTVTRSIKPDFVPVEVKVSPMMPGTVLFSDGSESLSSCLRCLSTPCMNYLDKEVTSFSIPDFPADRNPAVCPVAAISCANGGAPIVDSDACIFCGICASRCPVGAISMNPYAMVNDDLSEAFQESDDLADSEESLSAFISVPHYGALLEESDAVVEELRSRILAAWTRVGDRFPDHFARNLLLAVGVGASMRRKGDNAARMDIVLGPPWPEFGCVEVEFGDVSILDAPRDLMDSVAVAVSRYGKNKASLVAFVVLDVFPNRRSEYWRIIQDIQKVLGLNIGTVSIFALCLLVWHKKKLEDLPDRFFYVDIDTASYRSAVLEPLLGRKLRIGLDARPLVDVAK